MKGIYDLSSLQDIRVLQSGGAYQCCSENGEHVFVYREDKEAPSSILYSRVGLSLENGDDPLGGLADFGYTCSYFGEAAQGVVSVDVNAALKTDCLYSLKKPFSHVGKHGVAPPALSRL